MRKLNIKVTRLALAAALLATPAFADIPPADACMAADEGEACDNAGENADQPGICQADTCTRATPDGPMTYDCVLCKAAVGGGGGGDNEGGAKAEGGGTAEGGGQAEGGTTPEGGTKATGGSQTTGGSQSTAGTKPTNDDNGAAEDDGSCNAAAVPVGGLAGLIVPLMAFGLAAWRRRRARH